jgi:protein TonB
MKAVRKLVLVLSLGVLAGSVARATSSDEQAYLESCTKAPGVPVPVAVVTPDVAPGYAGATVQLEFVVDTTGKPVDLAVKSSPDDRLAATVLDAVKQWRFKPAERGGVPVETKVALPVKIVDDSLSGTRFASN